MILNEFLKNIFKTNVGWIANVLSEAIEKNAMNVSYSDEEIEKMMENMDEVQGNLEQMYRDAAAQTAKYEKEYESWAEKSKTLMQEQEKLYAALDENRTLWNEQESQMAKVRAESDSVERDINTVEQERRKLEEDLQAAIGKKKEKEEKLKTWCWVPGYGLYLGIDYMTDDLDAKVKTAKRKSDDLRRNYEQLRNRLVSAQQECEKIGRQMEEQKKRIDGIHTELKAVTQSLNDAKYQFVCWEDLKKRLEELKSKLAVGKNSPDVLLEVLDILEGMGGAA